MPSTVIRAPNHLGDLVMALPALRAAGRADVVVLRYLAPLLAQAGLDGEVIPLDRGPAGTLATARLLRSRHYLQGVLLTPSLGSAALFALGAVRRRRGTATDSRTALLTEPVRPDALAGLHRAAAYYALVSGERPAYAPAPVFAVTDAARAAWQAAAATVAGSGDRAAPTAPFVGIFPGGNARSRRWDAERFAEVARALAADGLRVVVFGGPDERALTAAVAGTWATDMGGRTTLPALAAGLAESALLFTNDSGPMHLAAAVGTRTVSLWGAGDPAVSRPLGPGHELLRRPELPCVPCVKNTCPRAGQRGFVLEDGENECIRLFTPADVGPRLREPA